jgi:succinoglycan biosynthesis transport protein ExoP
MEEQQTLEIGTYVDILKRRKWYLVIPAVLIILISGTVAMLLPPTYKSSATILIEEQEIPADFVMSTVTGYAEQRIQSTKQRIMSTSKLLEVIDQFNLYAKYRKKWTTEEMVAKMRKDIHLGFISADTKGKGGQAVTAMIAFTLSYQGSNPTTVQRVTDTLVTLFLSENLKVRQRKTTETTVFLEEEARRVKDQAAVLEKRISEFKEQNINILPEMFQVNQQALNSTESGLKQIDDQVRMLKEREGYLVTQLASIPEIEDPDRERLKMLELELVNLKSRFTDNYPDVKKVAWEIDLIKQKIEDKKSQKKSSQDRPDNTAYITLASQLSSTRAEIESLLEQESDLRVKADSYRQRIEETPKIEQEYNDLLIDRNNTRAKYQDLMRKVMEANVALGLEKEQKGERFTLIDPARRAEKPFKPNRLAIFVVGIVLGVAAGVGVVVLIEFLDQSVYSPQHLAGITPLPLLVTVPVIATPYEKRADRLKYISVAAVGTILILLSIYVFHTQVMDLDIFWAKLTRKIEKTVPPM